MNTVESRDTTGSDATPLVSPAVVIGVTGNMDPLTPAERIKESVREFFRFLRGANHGQASSRLALAHKDFGCGLEDWNGIDINTPILLLTSLARGADCIVAEVALEDEFVKLQFHVQAPLPFPPNIYSTASTFQPKGASEDQKRDWTKSFKDLVDKLIRRNPETVFPVLLQEDFEKTEEQRNKQFGADVMDSARSRLRYQAAGDYVAIQSDLLLAIWDDDFPDDSAEGTRAVVESKRRGPTSVLLPESSALSWADVGPVFHLHVRRLKSEKNNLPAHPERESQWRILHPYELSRANTIVRDTITWTWDPATVPEPNPKPAEIKDWKEEVEKAFRQWQEQGNKRFRRILALLSEFNRTEFPGKAGVEAETKTRIGPCKEMLALSNPAAYAHLQQLCAMQRRAGDENAKLARQKKSGMRIVFVLTLLGAMSLHLFAHWHLEGGGEKGVKFGLALTALLLGATGLGLFCIARSRRIEERTHDYRALAEAVRVQVAWCLAGVGRSVSANYMQRQRGELDWIRTAVSSLTAPYGRWRDWFRRMNRESQFKALSWVHQSWIEEQANYHGATSERRLYDLHFGHKLGGVLALAGLLHVVVQLLDLKIDLFHWLEKHGTACGYLAMGLVTLLLAIYGVCLKHKTRAHKKKKPNDSGLKSTRTSLLPAFKHMISSIVHTPHKEGQLARSERMQTMIQSFFGHLLPACIVLVVAIATDVCVSVMGHGTWPEAHHLAIVSMGFCFVSGALAVAWSERNLHSEEAYQYNAMASLFANGRSKMRQVLLQLETSLREGRTADFDRQATEAQTLIFALGKEALAENAEWLILHRARPMEPVMAG